MIVHRGRTVKHKIVLSAGTDTVAKYWVSVNNVQDRFYLMDLNISVSLVANYA